MTSHEMKIARLSKILTSVLKYKDSPDENYKESYNRVMKSLEQCIQEEKSFNREQVQIIKQAEEEERKRENMREAMQKHHFKLLQEQIAERAKNRGSVSEKRNWKVSDIKYEEGYVWKGMNRKEWRAILDSQIQEKKCLREKKVQCEIGLDIERIDIAKKSLEEELKIKENERQKRQNEMWESWEKTKEVHRLQKELEKVRRFGDSEKFVTPMSGRKKNDYFNDILKGYENTFGKVEVRTATKTGESIVSSGRLTRKRSKSSIYSSTSYTSALAKLGNLTQAEQKLKQERQELLKILDKSNCASKSNEKANLLCN